MGTEWHVVAAVLLVGAAAESAAGAVGAGSVAAGVATAAVVAAIAAEAGAASGLVAVAIDRVLAAVGAVHSECPSLLDPAP